MNSKMLILALLLSAASVTLIPSAEAVEPRLVYEGMDDCKWYTDEYILCEDYDFDPITDNGDTDSPIE